MAGFIIQTNIFHYLIKKAFPHEGLYHCSKHYVVILVSPGLFCTIFLGVVLFWSSQEQERVKAHFLPSTYARNFLRNFLKLIIIIFQIQITDIVKITTQKQRGLVNSSCAIVVVGIFTKINNCDNCSKTILVR